MKKLFAIAFTMCFCYGLEAQENIFIPGYDKEIDDEFGELFPPYGEVSRNRQLPRSFTIPYPDEESALAGSLAPSLYLQPMEERPSVSDKGTHVEYSWKYKIPFTWVGRLATVYIESADNPYTVIINGKEAGYNQSSRSPAEFDVTELSEEGVNNLTIRVEKNPMSAVLSSAKGTGQVTGKVLVFSQPRIRVRDYVYEVNYSAEQPTLQLGFIIKTHMLNARQIRLHYAIRDRDGARIAHGHRDAEVGLKEEDTVRFFVTVKDLKPWSYETPNTYDLSVSTQYEGRYTEYINYRTGFRNFRMHDGDLYSNGYKLPLSFYMMPGVPEKGSIQAELSRVKAEGHNIVVVPGYPQGEGFYRTCDSLGLYVCNQADINTANNAPDNPANDPRWSELFIDRTLAMHGASSNHPSVAMFSIARNSGNGYNLYESYLAMKGIEKNRPVIYPDAGGQWNSDAVTDVFARDFPEAAGDRLVLSPFAKAKAFPDKPYTTVVLSAGGECTVTNNALATKLNGELVYMVKRGKKAVSEGSVAVVLEPGASLQFQLPVPEEAAGKKLKFEAKLVSNFDGF